MGFKEKHGSEYWEQFNKQQEIDNLKHKENHPKYNAVLKILKDNKEYVNEAIHYAKECRTPEIANTLAKIAEVFDGEY